MKTNYLLTIGVMATALAYLLITNHLLDNNSPVDTQNCISIQSADFTPSNKWWLRKLPRVEFMSSSANDISIVLEEAKIEMPSGEILPRIILLKLNDKYFSMVADNVSVLDILASFSLETGNPVRIVEDKVYLGVN